ncbi:uncharacterized protein LOC133198836 [Saccostrea echinata]|uniref:uncharacterized protein LOC133198836 n=1 Tax=Saccostrea echinata TaxID=191078 RepID=UPI002A83A08D|nr:uncharacterized protein LOC133198836 [Saccostrea echinata]
MNHIPRLSEVVYYGLCHKIGSPTEVRFRREVMDTEEFVNNPLHIIRGYDRMKSGSTREGFRLRTSDEDHMLWISNHKVICDPSQISLYHIPQHTVILMECDDLPPGFTRLKLISPSNYPKIRSSCVMMNGEIYISSTLFRDNYFQDFKSRSALMASSFHHGPCSSSNIQNVEADFAFCLWSNHWPTIALPWIQRCRQRGWPSEIVLSEILSGFHVVPIGSTPDNGEEWRVSFSKAEQKLVCSMNHCQFLCYGLFKFFLKEVINLQNNTTMLCSYFIKTTVFWVIQHGNSLTWTPHNLLSSFWECFKLLIYWVRIGECPNFFIPQNNMFRKKVVGSAQTLMFSQLYDLYCKGVSCLLLSPTLRPYLSLSILYRSMSVFTNESSIISSTELDISFYKELYSDNAVCCMEEFRVYMEHLKNIIIRRLTSYQIVTLQYMTSIVLRNIAFLIQSSIYTNRYRNKIQYKANKVSNKLLKVSCTFGCVSDILYLAMYLYRDCRYEHSLNCLQKAQERMSQPYIMYGLNVNVNVYRQCMAGIPLGKKIRIAVVKDIVFNNEYTCINELAMEQIINKYGTPVLLIPPLVLLHMLLILNHHRQDDTVRSQEYLQDLHTLLLHDDGNNVPTDLRDISWQILGICQQICGDYIGSLQSYQYSLQQKPTHYIQEATLLRMKSLPLGEM